MLRRLLPDLSVENQSGQRTFTDNDLPVCPKCKKQKKFSRERDFRSHVKKCKKLFCPSCERTFLKTKFDFHICKPFSKSPALSLSSPVLSLSSSPNSLIGNSFLSPASSHVSQNFSPLSTIQNTPVSDILSSPRFQGHGNSPLAETPKRSSTKEASQKKVVYQCKHCLFNFQHFRYLRRHLKSKSCPKLYYGEKKSNYCSISNRCVRIRRKKPSSLHHFSNGKPSAFLRKRVNQTTRFIRACHGSKLGGTVSEKNEEIVRPASLGVFLATEQIASTSELSYLMDRSPKFQRASLQTRKKKNKVLQQKYFFQKIIDFELHACIC